MGLGFAVPYIGMFRGEAARLGALMPAGQGALVWPAAGNVLSVLVDEAMLPLPDASVDRLLVRALPGGLRERAGPLLREIWRVLAPEGRLLLIVPNRRGPLGAPRHHALRPRPPLQPRPARALLTDALFTPLEWTQRALHAAARSAMAGALGDRVRARGRQAVAGLCRRHHRRGEQGADGRACP